MPANFFSTPTLPNSTQFSIRLSPNTNKFISCCKASNSEFKFSLENGSNSTTAVKVPTTAPWMTTPLVLQPHEVIDLSKRRIKKRSSNEKGNQPDLALTGKERGVRGNKVMRKIVRSIDKLGEMRDLRNRERGFEELDFGECLEKIGEDGSEEFGGKMPWWRDEMVVFRRTKKEKVGSAAELSLGKELFDRLIDEAAKMRKWVKVKKAGVTQAVVDKVRMIWRTDELAMLKFDVPLCWNMDRAREIVEMRTGGLAVWSKKDTLAIYRGCNYQFTPQTSEEKHLDIFGSDEIRTPSFGQLMIENNLWAKSNEIADRNLAEKLAEKNEEGKSVPTSFFVGQEPIDGSLLERETDRLLDGLGPRFVDWWMRKPLPVDADLLPEVVPGFRPPFRLCPPYTKSKLTDSDLTYLRKLAHPLPTHFVLGRNMKLQGLATAILKLWKGILLVKIAVKWGIQNTNNEQMANELKYLTGGVLLLRNKYFIILYRGKDFVPCQVADLIAEREMELKLHQLHEEGARMKAAETVCKADELLASSSTIGTLSDFQNIQIEFGGLKKVHDVVDIQLEAEKQRLERELKEQERKLFILNMKIERSAKELSKLNSRWGHSKEDRDQEIMTEEERECFRKIGLKMHKCLVLGRRGVFDGVIEGMRQHWKHREVVKVITMQRSYVQVIYTAKLLEAESGGVLVSVEKLKEGYGIIIYRGKNFRRPLNPNADNLLTKREALHRSLELQRIGSMKFFAYQRQQAISKLKQSLANLQKKNMVNQRES